MQLELKEHQALSNIINVVRNSVEPQQKFTWPGTLFRHEGLDYPVFLEPKIMSVSLWGMNPDPRPCKIVGAGTKMTVESEGEPLFDTIGVGDEWRDFPNVKFTETDRCTARTAHVQNLGWGRVIVPTELVQRVAGTWRDGPDYVYSTDSGNSWKDAAGNPIPTPPGFEPDPVDPITRRVCEKMVSRAAVGLKKYGVGLSRKDLTLRQWLVHQQEEMMDAVGYAESVIDLVDRLKAKGIDVDELLKSE